MHTTEVTCQFLWRQFIWTFSCSCGEKGLARTYKKRAKKDEAIHIKEVTP